MVCWYVPKDLAQAFSRRHTHSSPPRAREKMGWHGLLPMHGISSEMKICRETEDEEL